MIIIFSIWPLIQINFQHMESDGYEPKWSMFYFSIEQLDSSESITLQHFVATGLDRHHDDDKHSSSHRHLFLFWFHLCIRYMFAAGQRTLFRSVSWLNCWHVYNPLQYLTRLLITLSIDVAHTSPDGSDCFNLSFSRESSTLAFSQILGHAVISNLKP